MTWIERYLGGRRFVLSMVSGAGTFLLCWIGRIDGNAYFLCTAAIAGTYIGGNTTEKIKGVANGPRTNSAP